MLDARGNSGVFGAEDFVRMPWQAFSTMKRFVSEGNRLENASWRLWYMEKLKRGQHRRNSLVQEDDDPFDEFALESHKCVYCDLASASLSCNGCCHDVYCVGCFKLIHMRGHLATHTAVQLPRQRSKSNASHAQKTPASPTTNSKPKHKLLNNAKAWEHKMDALFQRLMVTSLHHDGDISVHNLHLPDENASTATSTELPSRGKRAAICNTCGGPHMSIACPMLQPPAASSIPTQLPAHIPPIQCPTCKGPHLQCEDAQPPKSKKRPVCGNCRGDHMTIDCPQMPQASTPKHEKAAFVRKVYTNYHNDNTSNSTHAYLGDEVSVHGVHARSFHAVPPGSVALVPQVESIQEEAEEEAILPPVLPTLSERRPDIWILSALQEIPFDLSMQHLSKAGSLCDTNCWSDHMEYKGWVLVQPVALSADDDGLEMPRQWHRRYMVLFRNTLAEYVDERASRPIGYANVSEAQLSIDTEGILTLAVTKTALRADGWTLSQWKFDSIENAAEWHDALAQASRLKWADFFAEDKNGVELGQGRFSVVKRAKRKVPSQCAQECALKIIDKTAFWELVKGGIERNDTLFREVLTQSVLTMRSRTSHECFVVQLLSLFETHDHLVIEMELMHGGDVFDRISDKGPLPEKQAAIFISHLIQGIEFCLQNGVVHRDVKLSNLALDEGSEFGSQDKLTVLKLADFGMAAFVLPNGMLRGRCGTPGYVAPEILLAGVNEAYPPHVDMFSAGVVLYTLLCGYEPFFGRNDKELIALNKSVVYSFHPEEWAHISDDAKDLIQLMMQPDANDRITPREALQHPFLKDIPAGSFVGNMACLRLF